MGLMDPKYDVNSSFEAVLVGLMAYGLFWMFILFAIALSAIMGGG